MPDDSLPDLDIFLNAPADATDEELKNYLDEACGSDDGLRQRVESLFAADLTADEFMEQAPIVEGMEEVAGLADENAEAGVVIGRYKLLQKIGEGGFGTVWMAEQTRPISRMVALKVVKAGMDTRQVLARFEAERQALAMMDHPSIAKVLDAGATEGGRPYFVMELVKGIPITKFCDDQKLDTRHRLELFSEVCSAVNHAHQKGIIHRDLKPSNVMVTLHDGKPVPKVIDFGIAKATEQKLTDKTIFTRFEQFLGTPAYMSPEQAAMSGLDIDTRSDVYSLGVLLYELLAGAPPFNPKTLVSAGYDEMRRIIREDEPPKPSRRITETQGASGAPPPTIPPSALRGDLDWIVMKALEKERARRYETANAFAADIGRHLTDLPVLAGAPSATYRFRKFARRNKVTLAVTTAMALVLLSATVVSGWLAIRAIDAEELASNRLDQSEAARLEAQDVSKFIIDVLQSPVHEGGATTVADTLDTAAKQLENQLGDQPERRAKLQATLGSTYNALGLHKQAVALREKVYNYYLQQKGAAHPDTMGATEDLAASHGRGGQRELALKMLEDLLALTTEHTGRDHPATLAVINTIAQVHLRPEDGIEPRPVIEQAQPAPGAEPEPATTEQRTKQHAEVTAMLETAISRGADVNGRKHPVIASLMVTLGNAYRIARRHDEAVQTEKEALALLTDSRGPQHPETLKAMSALALTYFEMNRFEESLALNRDVATITTKRFGPETIPTLRARISVSVCLYRLRALDEQIQILQEVLEVALKIIAPDQLTAEVMANLGYAYDIVGGGDRLSVETWQESLRIRPKNGNVQYWCGKLLYDRKQYEEALPHLYATHNLYPRFSERAGENRSRLIACLRALGLGADAERLVQVSTNMELNWTEQLRGMANLAGTRNQFAKARNYYEKIEAATRETDSFEVASDLRNYLVVLTSLGEDGAAAQIAAQTVDRFRSNDSYSSGEMVAQLAVLNEGSGPYSLGTRKLEDVLALARRAENMVRTVTADDEYYEFYMGRRPNFLTTYALAELRNGNLEEAERAFAHGSPDAKYLPGQNLYHVSCRAIVRNRAGNRDLALADLDLAKSFYYQLLGSGNSTSRWGDDLTARILFKQALQEIDGSSDLPPPPIGFNLTVEPELSSTLSLRRLAENALRSGRLATASEHYRKLGAVTHDTNSVEVLHDLRNYVVTLTCMEEFARAADVAAQAADRFGDTDSFSSAEIVAKLAILRPVTEPADVGSKRLADALTLASKAEGKARSATEEDEDYAFYTHWRLNFVTTKALSELRNGNVNNAEAALTLGEPDPDFFPCQNLYYLSCRAIVRSRTGKRDLALADLESAVRVYMQWMASENPARHWIDSLIGRILLKEALQEIEGNGGFLIPFDRFGVQELKKLWTLHQKISGPEHYRTVAAMNELKLAYQKVRLSPDAGSIEEHRYLHQVAWDHHAAGEHDQAVQLGEELYNQCLNSPGPSALVTARVATDLAVFYRAVGRDQEAETIQQNLLGIDQEAWKSGAPQDARQRYLMAVYLLSEKRPEEAAAHLQVAREIHQSTKNEPDNGGRGLMPHEYVEVLRKLGRVYTALGKHDEAGETSKELDLVDPDRTDGVPFRSHELKTAISYLWLGEFGLYHAFSLQLLEEAADTTDPFLADAGAKIIALQPNFNQQHKDTARILAQRAGLDPFQGGWITMALGMIEYRRGDFTAAEAALGETINSGGSHPFAKGTSSYFLAMIYHHHGLTDKALSLFTATRSSMLPIPDADRHAIAKDHPFDQLVLWLAYEEADDLLGNPPIIPEDSSYTPLAVVVPPDSQWKWLHPTDCVDPASTDPDFHTTFFSSRFDDAAWNIGKDSNKPLGGFGYGDKGFEGVDLGLPVGEIDEENKGNGHSAYFRHTFTTDNPHSNLQLRCRYDDGIIIYLDGKEVARSNMMDGQEAYLLGAATAIANEDESTIRSISLDDVSLPPGKHVLAISLHNPAAPSSDLRIGGITLVEVGK